MDLQSPMYIAAAVNAIFSEGTDAVEALSDDEDQEGQTAGRPLVGGERPTEAAAREEIDRLVAAVKVAPPGSVAWRIGILIASLMSDESMNVRKQIVKV